MKNILLIISALFLSISSFSQKKDSADVAPYGDSTRFKLGDATVIIIDNKYDGEVKFGCDMDSLGKEKKEKDDWGAYLDLGMTGYMTPENSLVLPDEMALMELNYSRSYAVSFSSLYHGFTTKNERLYFAPGLGISWNSYSFKNTVDISTSNDSTVFSMDSLREYDKFRLTSTYLQVPVVVGVRLGNVEKPVGVQVGVIASYNVGSKLKQKYKIDETKYKSKVKDDFNISPFKLDAVARVSIQDVGLFAKYSLTPMFMAGKAPELNQFSVGITFGEF